MARELSNRSLGDEFVGAEVVNPAMETEDEEFFNNLVNEDLDLHSVVPAAHANMTWELSNLSLGDEFLETEVIEPTVEKEDHPSVSGQATELPVDNVMPLDSAPKRKGGISVKEVQWSSFGSIGGSGGDSGPFSDFLSEEIAAFGVATDHFSEQSLAKQPDGNSALVVSSGSDSATASEFSYFQQAASSSLETIAEEGTNASNVLNWGTTGIEGYPPNMLFDAQYPGFYYDTTTGQWHELSSYVQSTSVQTVHHQASQALNASVAVGEHAHYHLDQSTNFEAHWISSTNMAAPSELGAGISTDGFSGNQLTGSYGYDEHYGRRLNQQVAVKGVEYAASSQQLPSTNTFVPTTANQKDTFGAYDANMLHQQQAFNVFEPVMKTQVHAAKSFEPSNNDKILYQVPMPQSSSQHEGISNSKPPVGQSPVFLSNLSNNYYVNHDSGAVLQALPKANASYMPYPSAEDIRSSAGRPSCALVTFGFGGKLIIVREQNSKSQNFDYGKQGTSGHMISILNLSEIWLSKVGASRISDDAMCGYFDALLQQSFPGPLVGGNASAKDVNKWLHEMIEGFQSSSNEFQNWEPLKVLLSVLKIHCQHYGKLRFPYGSDFPAEGSDGPQLALTKLFSSAKKTGVPMSNFESIKHCMQNLPSESQMRASAVEVQHFLVSGRRKEALKCAQDSQLWGPALVIASLLGDEFYVETVKKMAQRHFIFGSPLRTLCLLIAGQPAEAVSLTNPDDPYVNFQQRGLQASSMLDEWEENLCIITANRTKDDELVMVHLGDCLWKEKGEVAAAHTCYIVAESNFESYSDSARLCLVGADHFKCPRTFAYPAAIQRTELYEYGKVLGNSQHVLLPFQPYKFIYAVMLAEVGKLSDSLRYCQASQKMLKSSGRSPEFETLKQLFASLEERIRINQQGGYGPDNAPAKFVGKIISSIDRSITRMMGAQAPVPQNNVNLRDGDYLDGQKLVTSNQSVMMKSSLVTSPSLQSMNELKGDGAKMIKHNRSVSEPDFGKSPKQASGTDGSQAGAHGVNGSRLGWLGSQLQKTVGWVSRSNHRQAKLGETNSFYYDENLKRWVDPNAQTPVEEPPLVPPPTVSFRKDLPDYNNNDLKASPGYGSQNANGFSNTKPSSNLDSSTLPPIPLSQNQFSSSRARTGVRSRYVDTFNKGGGSGTVVFQSPSVPSMKPPSGAKFFMPTAVASDVGEMTDFSSTANNHETDVQGNLLSSSREASLSSLPSASLFLPTSHSATPGSDTSYRSTNDPQRSRAASWGGTISAAVNSPFTEGNHVPYEQPSPASISLTRTISNPSTQLNGNALADELQEVEL